MPLDEVLLQGAFVAPATRAFDGRTAWLPGAPTARPLFPAAVRVHAAPDVWDVAGFLSAEECAHLVALAQARGRLRPSAVGAAAARPSPERRSRSAHLRPAEDAVVAAVEARAAALLARPVAHLEPLQVLLPLSRSPPRSAPPRAQPARCWRVLAGGRVRARRAVLPPSPPHPYCFPYPCPYCTLTPSLPSRFEEHLDTLPLEPPSEETRRQFAASGGQRVPPRPCGARARRASPCHGARLKGPPGRARQIGTLLLYLNDVASGGETFFPCAHPPYRFRV